VSDAVTFSRNRSTHSDIMGHLFECDSSFHPTLSHRVSIPDYSLKLATQADRFEAWADKKLAGLVAAYVNDPEGSISFISSVSVLNSWRRQGIAETLLNMCVNFVQKQNFEQIKLHVSSDNSGAVHLYQRSGFKILDHSENRLLMYVSLG